jgi:predicted GNAT family acetyltransferase
MLLTAVALAHTSNHVDKNTNREHQSRLSKLAFWRHKNHGKTGGSVAKMNHNKNREQHSRMSKLAFWRHHKDGDKIAKTAQTNHASLKSAQVVTAQTKPAPRTLAASKGGQHQVRHAAGGAHAPTTNATTKPRRTMEDRTTASLK